ncbi:DUF6134 family protein [Pedobacter sp. SYP-B3415]|uniref:DUF6134 family protein n=1 Tax=Pedobacter sp. SYP-B3415 TaxID=2496641 RepID=UPI00101C5F8A|nr:DUF6134 family protein [Pedobacter sp. SYP-B3415]
MIPALTIWLYKKFICPALLRRNITPPVLPDLTILKRAALPLFFMVLLCLIVSAQENSTTYRIIHKGDQIGSMQFVKKVTGDDLHLRMTSQIRTSLLFSIRVSTTDQAHFSKGRLLSSNVCRIVNGKEKDRKKTWLCSDDYKIVSGEKTKSFKSPIAYNMMLLYCKEPVNINQVYSDNFQQFVAIQKTGAHSYRIKLPDGNFNDYYFANGICQRVVVHHTLYTIQMELA